MVDAHLHLQDDRLEGHVSKIIKAVRREGVVMMITNALTPRDWGYMKRLAERYGWIIPCFGLHPWYVHEAGENWEDRLDQFLAETPAAVGEIGLDRLIEPRDEALQEKCFRAQLRLARKYSVPATIHCRGAWDWLMHVLADERPLCGGMLIHAYSGPPDLIDPLLKRGAYFSFAGTVFELENQMARESLRRVPADRLMIETDSPAKIPPEEYRPYSLTTQDGDEINHPLNLRAMYEGVANIRNVDVHEMAEQIVDNASVFLRYIVESGEFSY